MCGIAGFTTFGKLDQDPGRVIRAMTQALVHRGPDGVGQLVGSGIALGHRRLAILDAAGGTQPMTDPQRGLDLVYNGEIYNHPELRRGLEARGQVFTTRSDTEVLLQALAWDGDAALAQLDGMFAFACWDRGRRQLLLARDPAGIKPLHYCQVGPDLIFASELPALWQHPLVSRRLDPAAVGKYFSLGFVPAPQTMFAGVHKLEPGAWLRFDAHGLTQGFYPQSRPDDAPAAPPVLAGHGQELRRCLSDSVRQQLRGDVPAGVLLSGGLDSSLIAALAARESPERLRTFSIGFDTPSYDESRHARRMAAHLGTEHHEQILTARDAAALFPGAMATLGEPLADPSLVPTFALCGLAAREVKVVLGGDGADELFLGYPAFPLHRVAQSLALGARAGRGLEWLARRLPVSHRYTGAGFLLRRFAQGLALPPPARLMRWLGYCDEAEKTALFSPELRARLAGTDAFEDIGRLLRRGPEGEYQRLGYLCRQLYLQDGILVKLDRASMAHSLEARVPYLGREVVAWADRLDPVWKLRGLTTKFILKQAAAGLVPDEIIHRRKAGFMMPVAAWLAGDLRPIVEDLCAPAAVADTGLFDAGFVQRTLDEHFQRRRDHRKLIWPLLAFMAWWRRSGGLR